MMVDSLVARVLMWVWLFSGCLFLGKLSSFFGFSFFRG